jgi:hypothetical protein
MMQNKQLKKLKLGMNSISPKYTNDIENYIKKNIAKFQSEKRTTVASQFVSLQKEVAKTGIVKRESEKVVHQKKKLKEEIYEDVNILNDAQNNKEKGIDELKKQLIDLADYEQQLNTNIVQADKDIIV